MKINESDLLFACCLIELIGRITRQRRKEVTLLLGKNVIAHIYSQADMLQCEPIAKTADTFIDWYHLPQGDFDNATACKYTVPDYEVIGKVYAQLIEDVMEGDDVVETLLNVYDSPVSDMISDYNSGFYNQSRDFITKCFFSQDCQCEDRNDNCPAIRFRGFTDAWEQRKVREFTNVLSASRVHKDEWVCDGIPFFRSSDIVSAFNGNKNEKVFISHELYEELIKNSGSLEKDDILITGGGSIGIPYIVPNNQPLYSKDADLIWIKKSTEHDSFYLYVFFMCPCFHEYIRSISHVGTIAHYTIEQVKETPIRFPSKTEQEKIGAFFWNLDHLITLHQRKLDKLMKVKKSMLMKMFPQDGSPNPEIRFSGFTDAWEQRKAKDLFEATTEKNHSELPVLAATQEFGMVKRDDTGINISHDKRNEATYKRVLPGQFVIHLRSFQGGFAHSAFEGITSPAYTVFGFKEPQKHDDYFWKYIFRSDVFIHRLETVTYGIRDGRSISYEEFLTMNFLVPSYEEQKSISSELIKMDRLITLHQRKLEKLKKIKSSCLEKMFV